MTFHCILMTAFLLGASDIVADFSPDEMRRLLKSRDSQVDNARIRYTSTARLSRDAPTSFGAFTSGQPAPVAEPHPTVIDFTYDESMIVRGREVTFERILSNAVQKSGDPSSQMLPYQKWSTRGEDLKELTDDGSNAKFSKILEYQPKAAPVSLTDEQRMEIEFALGFGFGSRIKTIESIQKVGDRHELTGTIQIWWADKSTFRLLVDKDLIARVAEIDADVAGNLTRFEIDTDGTVDDTFLFAKNGRFARKWMGMRKNGEVRGVPAVKKQFAVEFRSVDWNLNDQTYSTLTEIEPDANTQVIDQTGRHMRAHVDGLADRRPNYLFVVMAANAAVVGVILAVWSIRRLLKRRQGP